jgi:hypothetical protein
MRFSFFTAALLLAATVCVVIAAPTDPAPLELCEVATSIAPGYKSHMLPRNGQALWWCETCDRDPSKAVSTVKVRGTDLFHEDYEAISKSSQTTFFVFHSIDGNRIYRVRPGQTCKIGFQFVGSVELYSQS